MTCSNPYHAKSGCAGREHECYDLEGIADAIVLLSRLSPEDREQAIERIRPPPSGKATAVPVEELEALAEEWERAARGVQSAGYVRDLRALIARARSGKDGGEG